MKRSDILRILEEALEKHTNISSSCCNLGINSESLSSVLGELEKAGILPPESNRSQRTMMFDLEHVQYAHIWDEDDFMEEE